MPKQQPDKIILRIANLHVNYGDVPVLTGLNLDVKQAESVAIMGRNGVGKTTLLRAIIGLVKAHIGVIEIGGRPIFQKKPNAIARMGVGYVPQGRGIFPKLSVRENLILGTRAASEQKEIDQQAFTYFPILADRLEQAGGTLSGGEQQMLAIARVLCGRPKILLLDEPSEGIQPSIVKLLRSLLPQIASQRNLTTILVEQNVNLATHVADRFVFVDKGRIVHECGQMGINDQRTLRRYLAV